MNKRTGWCFDEDSCADSKVIYYDGVIKILETDFEMVFGWDMEVTINWGTYKYFMSFLNVYFETSLTVV